MKTIHRPTKPSFATAMPPKAPPACPEAPDFGSMSLEELGQWIESAILNVLAMSTYIGLAVLELEKRPDAAELLQKIKAFPIVRMARLIATGVLAKEAFAALLTNEPLIKSICLLPAGEQIKLAEQGSVEIVAFVDGKETKRMKDLVNLKADEVKLLIDESEHRVRSTREQAALLDNVVAEVRQSKPYVHYDPNTDILTSQNATVEKVKAYMKKNGFRL
jgi:hypothetical protein